MKHRLLYGLMALSVVTSAACSETAGPDGSDSQVESLLTLGVAMVSGDAVIDDLAELQLAFVGGIGGAFAAPPTDRTRTVTFYDAAGNEQEAHDEVTTASIHIVSEFSGEMGRDSWSGSISRSRDMTISGLEGDETTRIANGSGSSTVSRSRHSDEDGDRSYDMSGTSLITDVVHGVPRDENPYPLSGTVTRDVGVVVVNGPNGDETRNKHVVITFDGTQFATMSVDGESFEVDLSTRDGRHPLRNRGR
jgi:hypothetical protein